VERAACSVSALIGFVFSGGAGLDIGVSLCEKVVCVGFGVLGIGFVFSFREE